MEPWFDEQTAGIVGGIMGGGLGIWGGLVLGGMRGYYVKKGLKRLAYCLYGFTFFFGAALVLTGCFALFMDQPAHVWGLFVLCGSITSVAMGAVIPTIRKRFSEHEKQMAAVNDS